jgi:hypothetical protein
MSSRRIFCLCTLTLMTIQWPLCPQDGYSACALWPWWQFNDLYVFKTDILLVHIDPDDNSMTFMSSRRIFCFIILTLMAIQWPLCLQDGYSACALWPWWQFNGLYVFKTDIPLVHLDPDDNSMTFMSSRRIFRLCILTLMTIQWPLCLQDGYSACASWPWWQLNDLYVFKTDILLVHLDPDDNSMTFMSSRRIFSWPV